MKRTAAIAALSASLLIGSASIATADQFLTTQKQSEKVASKLIGMWVLDPAGGVIGKITDVVLDQDHKAVGAVLSIGGIAVLSIGGIMMRGSRLVAVPWQSLKFETKNGRPVALVGQTREALANAPDYKTTAQLKADEELARLREKERRYQRQYPQPQRTTPGSKSQTPL
jgi:sporulation protein YlmC with PRC-barrel domain